MIIEVFLLVLLLLISFIVVNRDRRRYPPGPWEIPILGSRLVNYLEDAQEMARKYGHIFSVRVGNTRIVYITDYKLSKEVFSRPEFGGRIAWSIIMATEKEKREKNSNGVIISNGVRWQHNRRFLLRHLRDLGMGKSRMEGVIERETQEIVKEFEELEGRPSTIPFALNMGILNIVWQLVAGHRYTPEESTEVSGLIQKFNDAQETFSIAGLAEFFPFLGSILPKAFYQKFLHTTVYVDAVQNFKRHIKPFVEQHRETLNSDDPRDLIDEYLIEMDRDKDNEDSLFFEDDLLHNIFDLFIAGMDTTANSVTWFMLYMAKYQEEQDKAHQIIDQVVPFGVLPGLEHRDQLVYVDALVNETNRMSTFASFGVSHCALEDSTVNDFCIPKNSILMNVIGASHMDPRYWDHPQKFDPTRFISEDGKFIAQKDGFHPFGTGRRQCLGESLARMELFLISAAILKKFDILPCEGAEIDLKPRRVPMLHKPNIEQKLVFRKRN